MATTGHTGQDGAAAAAPPFDRVYEQHRRRVFAICLNSLGNADDAEDATQETFAKAAPHLANFEGNVAAYLTVVARNVCCDEVRRRSLQRRAANELGRRGGREEIESRAVDRSVLSRLLPRLTRGERELLMSSFAGYSYEEIADRTGSPVGTVRVRLARARQRARGLAGGVAALLLAPAWRLVHHAAQRASQARGVLSAPAVQVGLMSGALATTLVVVGVTGGFGHGQAGGRASRTVASAAGAPGSTPAVAGGMGSSGGGGAAGAVAGAGTAAGRQQAGTARSSSVSTTAAPGVLPRAADATVQQSWIDGMSTSPSSSSSGPVFAWGHTGATCNAGCELLFRSDDGGRTWQHLAAQGLMRGTVLVPPTFPADPTLLAVAPSAAVQVSHDGGTTWTVAPTGATPAGSGAAAVMPVAADGHPRIVYDAGGGSVAVYDSAAGLTTTYGLPAQVTQVVGVGFAGATPLVSVLETQLGDPLGAPLPAILTCQPGNGGGGASCGTPQNAQPPAWSRAPLTLVPVAGAPNLVAVVDGADTVYTTADAVTFTRAGATGLSGSVDAASARWTSGGLHIAVQAFDGVAAHAALLTPGGATPLHALPDGEASALLLLPGDTILSAGVDLDGSSQPGPRCSHDAGMQWSTAC